MRRTSLPLRGLARPVLHVLAAAAFACSLQTTGSLDGPAASASGSDGSGASIGSTDASLVDGNALSVGSDAHPFPGSEASPSGDDEVDAWVNPDALVLDPDAGTEAGVDGGGTTACDLDHDGHLAKGDTCGGDDCCDYDGRAYPGEQAYFDTANACGSFDYDCDGKTASRYPLEACKLGFLSCSGDGFAAQTACGTSSDYVSCGYNVFTCSQNKKPRIQPCR